LLILGTTSYDPFGPGEEGLSAREQRKLAAIVAVNVVGCSRLMDRDEVGTVARLRRVRTEQREPVLAGPRLAELPE